MTGFKVGKVTHYYDKISVAVVVLDGELSVGDRIKLVRGGEEMFEQSISSIQVEHQKIQSAKKGDIVGLKMDQKVREGSEVFKLS